MNLMQRTLAFFLFCAGCWTSAYSLRSNMLTSKYTHRNPKADTIRLMGEIGWDNTMKDMPDTVPPFTLFFAGDRITSNSNGLYELAVDRSEEHRLSDLSLIICKRTNPHFERGVTLDGMTIEKLGKCAWYNLKMEKKETGDNATFYWDIKEKTDIKPTDTLPENALVVLMSTNRVARIEDGGQSVSGLTMLPRIVLESNVGKVTRASDKAAIESIPFRRYTADKTRRTEQRDGVDMSHVA